MRKYNRVMKKEQEGAVPTKHAIGYEDWPVIDLENNTSRPEHTFVSTDRVPGSGTTSTNVLESETRRQLIESAASALGVSESEIRRRLDAGQEITWK